MTARIFVVGDDIDTDQLAPGKFMGGGITEMARHCLEAIRPEFAGQVRPGDILVAGRNFGAGSSREQAVEVLKHFGVSAVLAKSFAGIFYRNSINLGLPALVLSDASRIEDGDAGRLVLADSILKLPERNLNIALEKLPDILRQLLDDGGLVAQLKKRFSAEETKRAGS